MVTLVKRMITEFYQYGASISDIGDTLKRFLKLIQMLHQSRKCLCIFLKDPFLVICIAVFCFQEGKERVHRVQMSFTMKAIQALITLFFAGNNLAFKKKIQPSL